MAIVVTEDDVRRIASELVPPACEQAILQLLTHIVVFDDSVWSEVEALAKVRETLQVDSDMHARAPVRKI